MQLRGKRQGGNGHGTSVRGAGAVRWREGAVVEVQGLEENEDDGCDE